MSPSAARATPPRGARPPRRQAVHHVLPFVTRFPWTANLYPPFLAAGIRVRSVGSDRRSVTVELRQTWWNTNNYGAVFGGSLSALCDPFLVLLVMAQLGPDYRVWDKGADIRFLRPARRRVSATFIVTEDQIDDIRSRVEGDGVAEVHLPGQVHARDGSLVATVSKIVYVRRRVPGA